MPPQRTRRIQSALTPASRKSLTEDVAERLRDAILHGELSPGQRLLEEELGAILEVSRGPVREALMLLEREGLVQPARNRGVSVVELTRNDLEEIFTLRSALEPLAISLAIQRGDASDRAAMDAAQAEMTSAFSRRITERDAARLDVQFHDTIYRAGHHQRLATAWEQIRLPTYWFMLSRNVASPDWREGTVRGHAELVRVIKAGDEAVAAAAIKEHISFAYQRILESYISSNASANTDADSADTSSVPHPLPEDRSEDRSRGL
jgi:DNA-binding GntR family transcriptional regulator